MTPNHTTVREYIARQKHKTASTVLAMPSVQAEENKQKKSADRRVVTMPVLISTAGHRYLRYGSIERFRRAEGVTRRQAVDMIIACICTELFGTPRRVA